MVQSEADSGQPLPGGHGRERVAKFMDGGGQEPEVAPGAAGYGQRDGGSQGQQHLHPGDVGYVCLRERSREGVP